jgi:hypothetical protein
MTKDELFNALWENYTSLSPSAKQIHQVFEERGEVIVNDHIAFRTFNDCRVKLDVIAEPFRALGYIEKGHYEFKEKKLFAHHYEHSTDPTSPKVFISELILERCSTELRDIVTKVLDQVSFSDIDMHKLLLKGRLWDLSFSDYELLRKESEYASWMYVFGFCANHFTVYVNALKSFGSLQEVNEFLKDKGFKLNDSGGEIKGSPQELLEQSSTIADQIPVEFDDRVHKIPSCYYEFARRYKLDDGAMYQGFIAASADKIFESTNVSLVDKVLKNKL